MLSTTLKAAVYLVIILAVAALLGLAFVRFNQAAQSPPNVEPPTLAEKLKVIEKTTGLKTPVNDNFIRNERTRQDATREAEEAAAGGS